MVIPVSTINTEWTTNSKHGYAIAPNLLGRGFIAKQANQKWAVDISYIWTREGWLYLAAVMDLYSRRIVGWAVSNRMKRDLAIRALDMAIALRRPGNFQTPNEVFMAKTKEPPTVALQT